ncbi:MAG: hypothetical protein IJK38_10570 [Oscillospiraceae bacterium]|nr:hypothetical protein [Oscillospiraceae bacterium]
MCPKDNAGEVAAVWLESVVRDPGETPILSHLHTDLGNGLLYLDTHLLFYYTSNACRRAAKRQ